MINGGLDGGVRGGVIGGAAVPHAPQFFTLPDTEDHEQVARIEATMGQIGDGLRALNPDAVVIIANDHLQNFMLHAVPAFTVHRGPQVSGSFAERDFAWPVDSDLATDLIRSLQDQGFDPAASMNAGIGYEFAIPLTFLGFDQSTAIIPIYVNSYVPPQPPVDRCYAIGQAIRRAAALLGRRIVVIASGGLSHYPGTDLYSSPDVGTDEFLLRRIEGGNLRVLLDLGDEGLDRTGNVEARSWLMLAGALGERTPDTVSLEPSWHHNYAIVGWTGDGAEGKAAEQELHYPVPRSDQLPLYEALYGLRMSDDTCREFLADPEGYADRYDLRPDERAALVALDEKALRDLGVHPLLGFLARLETNLTKKADADQPAERTDASA